MKIKTTLLGLLFSNSIIHPICADSYVAYDKVDDIAMMPKEQDDKQREKTKNQSENFIKLGASVTVSPVITWQDAEWSAKNSPRAGLTFKAEVPKACCGKDAIVTINANWGGGKELGIQRADVTIGRMVTIGHTASIFSYEKADSALLISPSATVLQIKYDYAFDWFRFGYAIEKPVELAVGLFDKSEKRYDKKKEQDKSVFNELDDAKNKERPFKIRNNFPALGLKLGVVTEGLNIALSGLGRLTDYTHSTEPDLKNLPIKNAFTYGGHLGIHYEVVPKKFKITGQGAYVYGLGDYLPGLSAIQKDEERKEMCAVYYIDKNKPALSFIDAFGFGGTLEYAVTPDWTFSVRGSYLTAVKDSDKPVTAFRAKWNVVPEVAYQLNKYLTISSGYSFVQEYRVDDKENKKPEHKLSGSIKFSL